ncbi:BlaI/MecI/CopY family transcriptional regulator [Reichenbachiella ulvae]|uniref:BlaI/MecI/CopY family transcriptional regulator n=1 Tax=Reichenbachiella ulvae TaxID=2980104 RepID=A0ABT3CU20_9BACT|nr:BlaI/MecI/CopY family transcriptional regulator [Reichenbachiella ulvae]MCV9387049.1 BlaI/MecI/CopY family transcriptional regulator [Reichenbachiella ulvae]
MEQLTKAEEKIMRILWKIKKGFVKDIISEMEDPKPPYNTVSSVVRLLKDKGFVDAKAYGRTHEYFPLVSKNKYRKFSFMQLFQNYFDNSHEELLSFMVENKELKEKDVQEIKELLKKMD